MFTGITKDKYRVGRIQRDELLALTIDLGSYGSDLVEGASVAVNGVCLTVVQVNSGVVRFDIASETEHITNLRALTEGSWVNVERSLKFGDEVGGHILSGHIACCAEVVEFDQQAKDAKLTFKVPGRWVPYLLPKGFVALNGCSLTIVDFDRALGIGSINLIPETLRRTNLASLKPGDLLNLEVDSQTQTIVDSIQSFLQDEDWVKKTLA